MSSVDFPVEKFRFGMLLSDTRYRSTSLQVITFIFFVAGVFWLVDNTVKNLALLDKDISFSFLWMRAGYDINQRLIPYTKKKPKQMYKKNSDNNNNNNNIKKSEGRGEVFR